MPRFIVDTKLYGWDMPEQKLGQIKNRILLLAVLNAVVSVACGIVSTNVTRHNWVSFAATAALIALMAPRYLERWWRRPMPRARTAMLIAMIASLAVVFVVTGLRHGFNLRAQ